MKSEPFRPPSEFVTQETLSIASSQARLLDARWRDATWEKLETIADRSMVTYLRDQAAGWSTASEPATSTERTAERTWLTAQFSAVTSPVGYSSALRIGY